jgi:hypothetical protein
VHASTGIVLIAGSARIAATLPAVHLRHHQVHQDHVRPALANGVQRGAGRCRRPSREPECFSEAAMAVRQASLSSTTRTMLDGTSELRR